MSAPVPGRPSSASSDARRRKHEVLSHAVPSRVASIAEAVTVKNEDVYCLSAPNGCMPLTGGHGLGLYYHDCRYLNGYHIALDGAAPEALVANSSEGYRAIFQLTRAEAAPIDSVGETREVVELKLERVAEGDRPGLDDRLTLHNYGIAPARVTLALTFQPGFEDVFAVRGLLKQTLGWVAPPAWEDGHLVFRYLGLDGLHRTAAIAFDPPPDTTSDYTAQYALALPPQGTAEVRVSIALSETPRPEPTLGTAAMPSLADVRHRLRGDYDEWIADIMRVRTSSLMLNRILSQGLSDLLALRTSLRGLDFFAAGVPWFVTLFGRDSLLSAMQMLPFVPGVAHQTLRLLAAYQGREVNAWRDEEPGRILHELRSGELARRGEIPHVPFYGTIDATPLFLIVLERYQAWTGDTALFQDLRENVELALSWIQGRIDSHEGGYLAYNSSRGARLVNQGWKDSGDAVVNADGSIATPPIALVEVQGYVYRAWLATARMFRRAGEPERAAALERQAADLRQRFNRDFWLPDQGFFAMALQAGLAPAAVLSSNAGHVLWTGIVDQALAERTARRLMEPDMFSGWGIRTLSTKERRFNPVSYHLGTVWPHDSAMIAAGFHRYGFHAEAQRVLRGLFEAATRFDHYRMPELFSGFPSEDYMEPVHFPVACHPQAWAAGALPWLVMEMLDLSPEAESGRLRVATPAIPDWLDFIELEGLRVGQGQVDLAFHREWGGSAVQVQRVRGALAVTRE